MSESLGITEPGKQPIERTEGNGKLDERTSGFGRLFTNRLRSPSACPRGGTTISPSAGLARTSTPRLGRLTAATRSRATSKGSGEPSARGPVLEAGAAGINGGTLYAVIN
jgi:uncharacterized protein (DUF3084 family)